MTARIQTTGHDYTTTPSARSEHLGRGSQPLVTRRMRRARYSMERPAMPSHGWARSFERMLVPVVAVTAGLLIAVMVVRGLAAVARRLGVL